MCDEKTTQAQLKSLEAIEECLKNFIRKPIDTMIELSATKPYVIDYRDRKYIFLYSTNALTLTLEDVGTLSISANVWTNLCFPDGLRVFASNESTTVPVLIRCTDEIYSVDTSTSITFPSTQSVTFPSPQDINLVQSGGVAISATNPLITQTATTAFILDGQSFMASCGNLVTSTNANVVPCVASLFNPLASGKNCLVYSIEIATSTATVGSNVINLTTTDPAYSNVVVPTNMDFASATTSVASFTSSANNITTSPTPAGTTIAAFGYNATNMQELFQVGESLLVTPGKGIAIYLLVATAGKAFNSVVKWVEY